MKRVWIALILVAGAWVIAGRDAFVTPSPERSAPVSATPSETLAGDADAILGRAFETRQSNLQVRSQGVVRKVLADDNAGSRHQRFLLQLGSGQTVLIAHNIDLAPRIETLRQGDTVAFFGEYEWNDKGGVIHWTHHDPQGRHPDGWLEHRGRRYQ